MRREHYVIDVVRNGVHLFLLWYSDREDGLVTHAGRLRTFSSAEEASAFAASSGLDLHGECVARFDLDEIDSWTARPAAESLPRARLLDAWNLLGDLAGSVADPIATEALLGRHTLAAYDRLVFSCNIPALGAHGADNLLTASDCAIIAAALKHGIACLDGALTAGD